MDERDVSVVIEKKAARFSVPGIVVGTLGMAAAFMVPYYMAYKGRVVGQAQEARSIATFLTGLIILIRAFLPGRTVWRWVLTVIGASMLGTLFEYAFIGPTGSPGDPLVKLVLSIVCLYFGFRTKSPVPRATKQIAEP